MKKYLLTLLAIFVILAPNVKADSTPIDNPLDCFSIAQPSETKNIFSNVWGSDDKACGFNGYTIFYSYSNFTTQRDYYCINNFIEIEPSTTYTLTHFDKELLPIKSLSYNFIYLFDSDFNKVFGKQDWFAPPFNFTTTNDSKYLLYCTWNYYNSSTFPSNLSIQLEKGSISSADDLSYEEYKVKSTTPDTPDQPVADATLDGFYSIYLSKLSSLATFATENKIFFSALGILLSFAIFELFFMLFLGRRKTR